jgi:hypothetical protein
MSAPARVPAARLCLLKLPPASRSQGPFPHALDYDTIDIALAPTQRGRLGAPPRSPQETT